MNGLRTKRNKHHIAIVLLYITCYETITPITNSQSHNTHFVQKNPPWLVQDFAQSDINHNVLKVLNIDSKYTEQRIPHHNYFNGHPNNNKIVPKYTSKANKSVRNNESYRLTSAEAFASNGVPKYVRKTTTIKPVKSFVTALDENEWWAQYFRTFGKKYPLNKIDKSQRSNEKWRPTRTFNPVLLSKWSRTITGTSVLMDVGQYQKRIAEDNNVRSWTLKPSTYTMNQEPRTISQEPINAVKLYPETDKSLLSWREYDMRDINKTRHSRHMIKGKQFQQVPQRTILKSVFIL